MCTGKKEKKKIAWEFSQGSKRNKKKRMTREEKLNINKNEFIAKL